MPRGVMLQPGDIVHQRYRVVRHVGGGATAHVYEATDMRGGATIALKEQRTSMGADASGAILTALQEAGLLANLTHPNIPRIYDSFQEEGSIFLVMDLVQGRTLKAVLDDQLGSPLPVMDVVHWGMQIANVLDYLHHQDPPIIFRDIKPSNLILQPDGGVSMVDFGIARHFQQGASSDTRVLGSPGYAPPEQYGKGQTDPRSDIYSLGACLHHLLTGRDPATAPFQWPSARSINPRVPVLLDRLIMRCVDFDSARRPWSAGEVSESLKRTLEWMEEQSVLARSAALLGDMPLEALVAPSPRPYRLPPWNMETYAETNPALPERTASVVQQWEYMWLFICSFPVLVFTLLFPVVRELLAPGNAVSASPANVPTDPETLRQTIDFMNSGYAQARMAYDHLAWVQWILVILVFIAFSVGVVAPRRPTRIGLIWALGGVLGLLCLDAALFLPGRAGAAMICAALHALLLIPITLLMVGFRKSPSDTKR